MSRGLVTAALFLRFAFMGLAVDPEYEVIRLGLVGGEFANPSGLGSTTLDRFNGTDVVAGVSVRYNASGLTIGHGAWVAGTDTGLTLRVGLTGAEFTAATAVATYLAGHQSSAVAFLAGRYAAGTSLMFNSSDIANTNPGEAAWVANTSTGATTRVGLFSSQYETVTGPNYTATQSFRDTDGFQRTLLTGMSELAEAWGVSYIYDSAGNLDGEAAWVADAATGVTQRMGLFGAGYRTSGGAQYSAVRSVMAGGWAAGHSRRYSATNQFNGQQAWVQNIANGSPISIGLFGADLASGTIGTTTTSVASFFRASDGLQTHQIQATGNGGFVGGYTSRYQTVTYTPLGQGAWVYNTATAEPAKRVGFTQTGYRTSAGSETSNIVNISGNGLTIGTSLRYDPATSASLGRTAFVHDAANPSAQSQRVGLTGGEFDGVGQFQVSVPKFVTASGFVAGTSDVSPTTTGNLGVAAWSARAGVDNSTIRIGLTPTTFTGGATQVSDVSKLTESGYAGGSTKNYAVGGALVGSAAWIANATTGATTRLGLFGTGYSGNGIQESRLQFLTESGYAAGSSTRYSGANPNGATAWVYQAPTSLFTPIVLSILPPGQTAVRPSDQYSNTQIFALYESGLVLGTYELFSSTSSLTLGDRAFAWTPTDGAYDLGVEIGTALDTHGWASLQSALFADINGRILGHGTRLSNSNSGDSVYLLTTIPEPRSGLFLFFGLTWCAWRRRVRG